MAAIVRDRAAGPCLLTLRARAALPAALTLALILFDGGLRTKFSILRGAAAPAILLATVGVLLTAALTGAVASILLFGKIYWTKLKSVFKRQQD